MESLIQEWQTLCKEMDSDHLMDLDTLIIQYGLT